VKTLSANAVGVGGNVGTLVGLRDIGVAVGRAVVGASVLGAWEGVTLGTSDGAADGAVVGSCEGTVDGAGLGDSVGSRVGAAVGPALGENDGEFDGLPDGGIVGKATGAPVGGSEKREARSSSQEKLGVAKASVMTAFMDDTSAPHSTLVLHFKNPPAAQPKVGNDIRPWLKGSRTRAKAGPTMVHWDTFANPTT